jgi:hypothetical protein
LRASRRSGLRPMGCRIDRWFEPDKPNRRLTLSVTDASRRRLHPSRPSCGSREAA